MDIERDARKASASGFNAATDQMISHFDAALTRFEADVHTGKAAVHVVHRNASALSLGGGSAFGVWELIVLLLLVVGRARFGRGRGSAVARREL